MNFKIYDITDTLKDFKGNKMWYIDMHRHRYTHFQICLRYFGVKEGQLLTIDMCFRLLISTEAWRFQLKTFHILVWESRSQKLLFSSLFQHLPSIFLRMQIWPTLDQHLFGNMHRNNSCQRIICHSCCFSQTNNIFEPLLPFWSLHICL